MSNKERMLHMVLDDPKLQELYDYDKSEYEDLYQALNSENVIVAALGNTVIISRGQVMYPIYSKTIFLK